MPAPQRLAPYSAAIGASVYREDDEIAVGRLILLFDPDGQRGWDGQFRLVAYVRADMEPEITADPLLGPVAWSWLTEALETHAPATPPLAAPSPGRSPRASATSRRPGRPPSWSCVPPGHPPEEDLSGHVAAWCDLMCLAAGIPPPCRPDVSRPGLPAGLETVEQGSGRRVECRSDVSRWRLSRETRHRRTRRRR